MLTDAQAAYEKWAEFGLHQRLRWDQLPGSAKAGWKEVADAAIENHRANENTIQDKNRTDANGSS